MRMCKIMYLNSFYNIVAYNVNVILFQYFNQYSSRRGVRFVQQCPGSLSFACFLLSRRTTPCAAGVRWDFPTGEGGRASAWDPSRVCGCPHMVGEIRLNAVHSARTRSASYSCLEQRRG